MEVKQNQNQNQTQRERKKNLSRMQKLGLEKSSDFMKNLGSQVDELNSFTLSPRFEIKIQESKSNEFTRKNNEEQKSESEFKSEQRHSVSGSNREEDDSELLRCREKLQENQRQQRDEQLYQSLEYGQYEQEMGMYAEFGNNWIFLINQSQIQYKEQILFNQPNEYDLIAEERWQNQNEQKEAYDLKKEQKQQRNLNINKESLGIDLPLTDFTYNAEQQIYSLFENNPSFNHSLENRICYAKDGQKIVSQNNNRDQNVLSNSALNPVVTQPKTTTNLTEISGQKSYQNFQKPSKVIQQLRQELVHKITDDLQAIFDLFKQKIPHKDEIQIIKALHLRYIGLQEKNQKNKNVPVKKNENIINAAMNDSNLKSNSNIQTHKYQPKLNPSQQIEFKSYTDQGYPDPPRIIPHLHIPKVDYPKVQLKVDQPTKRPYTKRGEEINQRYLDEQSVARLFISKGYGLHVARKYLAENIQNNHYTNLITAIIRETWRKIEDCISRFQQIKPMNTNQYKVIKTSLVQSAKWMDHTDLQTLHSFLKIAYNFDNRQPHKQQAMRLYNACINRYQELRGQYETQSKIKTERKYVQKIKNSSIYSNQIKPVSNSGIHQRKLPRTGPSDHELGDIISLIKNQLKQNNGHPPSYNQPQRQQMPSNPPMTRYQTQNDFRNSFPPNPKNGPRS